MRWLPSLAAAVAVLAPALAGAQTKIDFFFPVPVDGKLAREMTRLTKAYNDSQNKRHGDWSRIASIPLNIYHEQLAEAQSQKDEKYMSKWLNDPDNRAFRTFGGTV